MGFGGGGGDALCAALHTGSCRGWALFAGGAKVLEVMRRVRLCVLEAVEETEMLEDVEGGSVYGGVGGA